MVIQTLHSTKKIFFYNFFPTKAEEDFWKGREDPVPILYDRVLIEMRDIYPPRVVDPDDPWLIKKTLNKYEALYGKLILSSTDVLEHVVRYWTFSMASYIADGQGVVGVSVWDVSEEENPRKYDTSYGFYMQMTANNFFVLSCVELIRDRELRVGDEVLLYWDASDSNFKFKAN